MYMVIMFGLTGILGTVIALRLMAIDAQEVGTNLTVRGRIVVGVLIGLVIASIVILINGFWWDCDLTTDSVCKVVWHY